jgi:hypothetical protein
MIENAVLAATGLRKPLIERLRGPSRWLEEYVCYSHSVFAFLADRAIVESVYSDRTIRLMLSGAIVPSEPEGLLLRITVSSKLFTRNFRLAVAGQT